MPLNGFLVVDPNGRSNPHDTAAVLNSTRAGKLNCLFEVTLTAGAGSTVVTEATHPGAARIGPDSHIDPEPLTASAATEKVNGTFRVSARDNGTCTFTHANSGVADRTFRVSITG